MMKPVTFLQPGYFDAFHCIGAACEDTCCTGWIVQIDKPTYGKYQSCVDPALAPSLRTLVTINESSRNDDDYAKIVLNEAATCPFLGEGLCSIQQRLGEDHLSNMCATYPRIVNRVDDQWQRSLDLSCPEAARLALLNPERMVFQEEAYQAGSIRPGNYPALDGAGMESSAFLDIQRSVIAHLQDRSFPLWKRLFGLGRDGENHADTGGLRNPALQLEVVLELIVERITSDANPRRFLECYGEFMQGLQWTAQSTMGEIGARYSGAHAQSFAPFLRQHEFMLEHYLVNYAYRTLFPFGLQESNRRLQDDGRLSLFDAQYMLMIAHYAIVRTLLIGMAGFHKEAFGADHVVKLIQSCSKTFEHSLTYPRRVVEILAEKGMTTPASLSVLYRD